jgi:hypothetical protein
MFWLLLGLLQVPQLILLVITGVIKGNRQFTPMYLLPVSVMLLEIRAVE